MTSKLKKYSVALLPVVAMLFAGVAVREHMAKKAYGGSAAVEIGDVPLSEIAAGLTALAAALGSAVVAFRKASGIAPEADSDNPQPHLAALAAIYLKLKDRKKLDLVRDLGAPVETEPTKTP